VSNANELLRQALETWAFWHPVIDPEDEPLFRDIRAYLDAEPEVNLEALGIAEIAKEYPYAKEYEFWWFIRGVRFAEKYHGIGGGDE